MNTLYYWTFGAWMSYFINHPQYTTPLFGNSQIYTGLTMFTVRNEYVYCIRSLQYLAAHYGSMSNFNNSPE